MHGCRCYYSVVLFSLYLLTSLPSSGTNVYFKVFLCSNCYEITQCPSNNNYWEYDNKGKWNSGKVCLVDGSPSPIYCACLNFILISTFISSENSFLFFIFFVGVSSSFPVGYITPQALMIIAVFVFMAVLIREFQRLKEVWKYFH